MGKFHYRDGWYFEQLEDGSVRITYPGGWIDGGKRDVEEFIIDTDSWCSIIASMSRSGETAEKWQEANRFHKGVQQQVITFGDIGRVEDIL